MNKLNIYFSKKNKKYYCTSAPKCNSCNNKIYTLFLFSIDYFKNKDPEIIVLCRMCMGKHKSYADRRENAIVIVESEYYLPSDCIKVVYGNLQTKYVKNVDESKIIDRTKYAGRPGYTWGDGKNIQIGNPKYEKICHEKDKEIDVKKADDILVDIANATPIGFNGELIENKQNKKLK